MLSAQVQSHTPKASMSSLLCLQSPHVGPSLSDSHQGLPYAPVRHAPVGRTGFPNFCHQPRFHLRGKHGRCVIQCRMWVSAYCCFWGKPRVPTSHDSRDDLGFGLLKVMQNTRISKACLGRVPHFLVAGPRPLATHHAQSKGRSSQQQTRNPRLHACSFGFCLSSARCPC